MVSLLVRVKSKTFVCLLSLCGLLLLSQPGLAAVQVSIDRENVYQGESFTLTISSDASQSEKPDLSLLEKDFQILGTGSSRQFQVINGAATARTSWSIQLQARATGQFLIPSLRVGKQLTNPVQVTVLEPPESSSVADGQHVFIEVEIESGDKPIYLQQQILYTVRLIFDQPILDGSLSEPTPENALVEQLGKNDRAKTQRNGRTFNVIERRYVIFPEKSGQIFIPPLRFQGSLVDNSKRSQPNRNIDPMMRQFFGGDPFARMQVQGRPVTVQSKGMSLEVLPRPATFSSPYWLPAAGIELIDSWAETPPEVKVGEPVTRTLSINAKGLLATLLPKLDVADVDGFSIYPEQPETETRTDGTWVYGISQQNLSYMPTREGVLEIPEQQLTWWDTAAGVERTAVLPKWTVDVAAGENVIEQYALQSDQKKLPEEQVETPAIDGNLTSEAEQDESLLKQAQKNWKWLLAVLLLIIATTFWRQKNRSKKDSNEKKKTLGEKEIRRVNSNSLSKLQQKFQQACNDNDAGSAAEMLLQMAAIIKPANMPKTLPALAYMLEAGSDEINRLDRLLYASDEAQWNGASCYEMFKDGLQFKSSAKKATEALAPLYPT